MIRRAGTRLVVALLVGAAAPVSAVAQARDEAQADTAMFAAVVREVAARLDIPWRADPRPLRPDASVTEARAESRAAVSPDVLAARAAVLRRAGVAEVDAAAPLGCASGLVEYTRGTGGRGCPASPEAIVAVGMPRTGGAYYPAARIDRRKVGRARGYRTARVLITRLGPRGAVTTVYDYELAPQARGWRVVNRFPVLAVD